MGQVDTAHVAVAEHRDRPSCDTVGKQVVPHPLSLGYDVGGAGTGDAVGRGEQQASQPAGCREEQSGEGVDTQRHSGYAGGYHAEQSGLRGHGVEHVGAFAT